MCLLCSCIPRGGQGRAREGHEKIFPNVLKRGAGESDRDSRPSSAMALSTPRQPATRGMDDPGMGGVPPAADWGRIASLHGHSLPTVPHQPCAGYSRARRDKPRCAPGRGLWTHSWRPEKPQVAVWERRRRRKSLPPLGRSRGRPFVRAPAEFAQRRRFSASPA